MHKYRKHKQGERFPQIQKLIVLMCLPTESAIAELSDIEYLTGQPSPVILSVVACSERDGAEGKIIELNACQS